MSSEGGAQDHRPRQARGAGGLVVRLWLSWLLVAGLLASCASVPGEAQLLALWRADGPATARAAEVHTGTCPSHARPAEPQADAALPQPLRVLSWNLHKGADTGWQDDLARLAATSDLLLLQEALHDPALRAVLEPRGLGWQLAGSFAMGGIERGVLNAARAAPEAICTLRSFEPLWPIPKSVLIGRYRLAGTPQLLAVANLHAVNFSLGLERYGEQLQAMVDELARHAGPLLVAGDFNAWSEARQAEMQRRLQPLGLQRVSWPADVRRRVFGHALDEVWVRGLVVDEARTEPVSSSDHNPLLLTLRLKP